MNIDTTSHTSHNRFSELIASRITRMSPCLQQKWRAIDSLLRKFESESGTTLSTDTFTLSTFESIITYLNKKGLTINAVNIVKKGIYLLLADVGLNRRLPKFVPEPENDQIYLTHDELKAIHDLNDLTADQEFFRKIFLLQCNTGLSLSDQILKIENQKAYIISHKTGRQRVIPLSSGDMQILASLGFIIPIEFPHPKYISGIRDLCKKAEITQICKVNLHGRKRNVEKYKLVHTFTSRHTAIVNRYIDGGDLQEISDFAGFESPRQLEYYLNRWGLVRSKETAVSILLNMLASHHNNRLPSGIKSIIKKLHKIQNIKKTKS